jgi:predicted nucleic acid-binding protein
LRIQEEIRNGIYELVWSYILDYENSKNPFQERREQISKWAIYSKEDKVQNNGILVLANTIQSYGMKKIDSLHIACAIDAGADYFLTTDDLILKKSKYIENIKVTDPIGFVKEELP